MEEIIKKERDFRKQNEELEQKTKELLRRVDVMKIQEDVVEKATFPISSSDLKLPKSVDEMGTKATLQFYKAKIKTTQDNLEKLQTELKTKCEEVKKWQKQQQSTVEEKEKWFLQYHLEKNNNAKLEKQVSSWNAKFQVKDSENVAMKKEMELLKNELKVSQTELNSSEARLQRTTTELEKIKATLKTQRKEEKESKNAYKNSLQDLTSTVKQIQRHKIELVQGYKKQIQLIDNLKKQKAHVEAYKVLEMAEDDFGKLLDWKLE